MDRLSDCGVADVICATTGGEVRLPVRSLPRVLPGELVISQTPSGVHDLHHGGSVLAAAGHHALPLHPHRHRAVDPQTGRGFVRAQHHEPPGDQ